MVREDIDRVKNSVVSVISGGICGQEPLHIGYVGAGCLSGVVRLPGVVVIGFCARVWQGSINLIDFL